MQDAIQPTAVDACAADSVARQVAGQQQDSRVLHCYQRADYGIMSAALEYSVHCQFLPRDAMHKHGLCHHAVSACVCLSHLCIVS